MNKKDYPASVTITSDGGRIVQTCCFECHSKCGVLVYVDSNERVRKVTGNPEDPRNKGTVCGKAQAGKKILYHPERVNYPLKRVGAKGEGKWKRITWDEAMDTISTKLLEYKEKYGPESVVFGQGTGRGTNQWNQRLGKSLGIRISGSTERFLEKRLLKPRSLRRELRDLLTILWMRQVPVMRQITLLLT